MADFSAFRRAYPPGSTLTMEPTADGWPVRVFRWPAQDPAGSILFAGGRGDIIEKYLESFAYWHAQGWAIAAFDWRGQGGSGRLTSNPMTGHVPDFGLWIDDLEEFAKGWAKETAAPHVAIGHSMGGHLVLRALAEKRIAPDGVVLVSPMLGFDAGRLPLGLAAALLKVAARLAPERPAWKANERPASAGISRQSLLTGDAERYADELWWKDEKPELALGPPSLKWLEQAYSSNLALESRLKDVTTPMLVLGTWGDRLVSAAAIERFAARLPHVCLKIFEAPVAHEILRERDAVRDQALAEIDRLLGQVRALR